jgi:hypothetical protein
MIDSRARLRDEDWQPASKRATRSGAQPIADCFATGAGTETSARLPMLQKAAIKCPAGGTSKTREKKTRDACKSASRVCG